MFLFRDSGLVVCITHNIDCGSLAFKYNRYNNGIHVS